MLRSIAYRMRVMLFLGGVLLYINGCDTEDIKAPSYVWKYPLSDTKNFGDFHKADELPTYENIALMFGQKNGKMMFYGIDVEKGALLWENSQFGIGKGVVNSNKIYMKSYMWVFDIDDVLYGIDIRTGKVMWSSHIDGVSFNMATLMAGNGDYFYCQGTEKIIGKQGEGYVDRPWRGNVFTGVIERIPSTLEMSTDFKCEGSYGSAFAIPVISEDVMNEKILVSMIHTPKEEGYTGCNFDTQEGNGWHLGLYDVTNHTWLYIHHLNDLSHSGGPGQYNASNIVYNGRYYGTGMFCFDVVTGNLVWKNTDDPQGGSIKLVGNRLLFEGAGVGHAFDTATGKVVYNFDASNTSALVELNGIVYYVDSDLRLHAVEVSSGKELWKIDSPDYLADKSTSYWKFATEIGVVPGQNGQKGRILVHTYLNAYAYEAIR